MKIYAPKGVDVFERHDLDPDVLEQEKAEIELQRAARGIDESKPTVGMAISGGGIRSALSVWVSWRLSKSKVY